MRRHLLIPTNNDLENFFFIYHIYTRRRYEKRRGTEQASNPDGLIKTEGNKMKKFYLIILMSFVIVSCEGVGYIFFPFQPIATFKGCLLVHCEEEGLILDADSTELQHLDEDLVLTLSVDTEKFLENFKYRHYFHVDVTDFSTNSHYNLSTYFLEVTQFFTGENREEIRDITVFENETFEEFWKFITELTEQETRDPTTEVSFKLQRGAREFKYAYDTVPDNPVTNTLATNSAICVRFTYQEVFYPYLVSNTFCEEIGNQS